MNNEMISLKLTAQEAGVSKHFPITHLNSETVFETQSGQVGSVIRLQGIPFDTATNEQLNYHRNLWHHALCLLNEEFCLYTQLIRKKITIELPGKFNSAFCRTVNERYQKQFKESQLYKNELYLILIYKGINLPKWSGSLGFLKNLNHQAVRTARQIFRERAINSLKKTTEQLLASLQAFQPKLLGKTDEGFSELLRYLPLSINGLKTLPFFHCEYFTPIAKGINQAKQSTKQYPRGNLANYLPNKRISFGEFIEFQANDGNSQYACMLSIKNYGTTSHCLMLNKLLQLDCELIHTNSFAIEENSRAQAMINKQCIRLENSNDPAISQLQDLQQCKDDIASDKAKLGYHHNSVMLIANSKEKLKTAINKAIKIYSDHAFIAIRETLGQEATFWAQIPGNQRYIARATLITSQNFIDFSPLHNYQIGYRDGNHLGSAVSLLETPSRTPVFFNFHSQGSGSKNDLTPGHTTIIGGNGSGKTVFMGFMDSQISRYGGKSFFFDRDYGLSIYIKACDGYYEAIKPGQTLCFNPFLLTDTASNRNFLIQWLSQLVIKENETELPEEISSQLTDCIHFAFDTLAPEHRCLSTVTSLLPINFSRWDRLRKWLRANNEKAEGEYAYLFDNHEDKLSLNFEKCGFDLTYLSTQPNSVLTACMMYLFHRIEESLDGQRVSIYLDEGWMYLNNPYWQNKLASWLPTLRKKNCHIVLATQSPESVVTSSLSSQFLDNCASNLFFCNPTANFEKHYQHFGITSSEFDFLKNTPREKRLLLYKQQQQSIICRLNLSNLKEALNVYSANSNSIALMQNCISTFGDKASAWLPHFYKKIMAGEQ
jgi:type IV secretion system protein VirB4